MMLTITGTNFTTSFDWLFKLSDDKGDDFYIMDNKFYKSHKIKDIITKKELDYFDKGTVINCVVEEIDGKNVVVNFRGLF